MGQSAGIAHFVAFFRSFHNLKITIWGKQGLLVIQKTILFTCTCRFVKNLWFLPQNDQQNTQTVLGTSEMTTYDIYHKNIS
jgi:hypothetical protein